MAEEILDNKERDEIFATIRSNPENNFCIDCDKKNPRWASVYLGVHLCIDCAGKHRQFTVVYSFVRSTNLDTWNRKQIAFMKLGGNTRALEYFKKCGIITPNNRHIDYKSQIVQKYKAILTEEVEKLLNINQQPADNNHHAPVTTKEPTVVTAMNSLSLNDKKDSKTESNLQNSALEVQAENLGFESKKKKKNKVNAVKATFDFDEFIPDDGISQAEKDQMAPKVYVETTPAENKFNSSSDTNGFGSGGSPNKIEAPIIEAPKEMEAEAARQKLEKLKEQTNVKAISSEQFKDNSVSAAVMQQNLSRFSGASGISSAAFFGQPEPKEEGMDKIKNLLSSAGEKLYGKFSAYLNRS